MSGSEQCCCRTFHLINTDPIPLQVWTRPKGSRSLRLPEFTDICHKKVVTLSALRTRRFYPLEYISGTHFCWRLSRLQCVLFYLLKCGLSIWLPRLTQIGLAHIHLFTHSLNYREMELCTSSEPVLKIN